MKIVNDNYTYAKLVKFVKDKTSLTSEMLEDITEVIGDEDKAREVIEAAKASMGMFSQILFQELAVEEAYLPACDLRLDLCVTCLSCINRCR